ncbi:DUF3179 domain-containing (seleno)protein [Aureibaculum conchae]|uniref:DUF3179 domain-containing (seleno)protein n=1 Tax=Aureibaculum sp. 2308TA14-22 TaxID=3108392 RepID=UPI00339B87B0
MKFRLIDEVTKKPIVDAHIFINNSSLGTISDKNGYCKLNVSKQETQLLVIRHVLYKTLSISPEQYQSLVNRDTLEMFGKTVNLNEVLLTAKKSRKWKKNFRRFRKTLLGEGKAAASCKILNPEVLQFEEKNEILTVNATDLLEIENDYLGYTIRFWLEELSIKTDGSTYYKGNGQYINKAKPDDTRYSKRRENIYTHSLPHFLRSLLKSPNKAALKELGYELTFEEYEAGTFKTILNPTELSTLIQPDSLTGNYQLHFPEFLTIKHLGLTMSSENEVQVNVSLAEQRKLGSSRTQSLGKKVQNQVSRLYKIEPYLLFDKRGNIINKAAVREYGYWANQRLASTLPIDYNSFLDSNTKQSAPKLVDTLQIFKNLIGYDQQKKTAALRFLQQNWSQGYIAPLLDILRLSKDDWQQQEIKAVLNKHEPELKADYFNGIQWLWKRSPKYGNYYADFKGYLYSAVDSAFYKYFTGRENQTIIRLDEIVWGGVSKDGIPTLKSPTMMAANEATYLSDTDVVFGLVIHGEARAYPKRILAWHEFLTDDIGDQSIAVVYCTLCGTVIIYDTEYNGVKHKLGTSGFLYRSNKLMYDQATQSLWNTIMGTPVVGPLVEQNIELSTLPVETTTWGAWRKRHPTTQVLSIETGHARNYAEGEAYKDYFADDNLMFPVQRLDRRLPNKARVFIPRPKNFAAQPLAIAVDYLKRKRIHHDKIEDQRLLIITESNGASRAYAIDNQQFKTYKNGKLKDINGEVWLVKEEALVGPEKQRLLRIPAHEVFWFAWVNVFPETRIIY